MKYRSPMKKAKGLGSSHHGADHWMMQRLTAIALIPLMLWLMSYGIDVMNQPFETAKAIVATPYVSIVLILLMVAMLYHAMLGLQVVIEDYVSCSCGRPFLIILTKLGLFTLGVISVYSILKISFGA